MFLSFGVNERKKFMDPVMLFGSQFDQIPFGISAATGAGNDVMNFAIFGRVKWILLTIYND